ncbi:hypothetical protein D5Q48_02625 [Salmonella enterica subsp. enterica serovar Larochelle]|nr:hypothetical protein [Salmonella enterica subsp. enterica serovar Larochelle]EDD7082516.1 hypothetical protein [Salmonella enterica subsp. enterica serovar Enteritidis]
MNMNILDDTRSSFFTQMNVNPERTRAILSTGWKLKLLGELTLNRTDWPEEATVLINTIHSEWLDATLNAPQLRPYYRMLHAGYEAYRKGWYAAAAYCNTPEGREDNTVDHVLVNNFWGDQIEVLQLSTGDRIPACELFETNAQMYEPYAMIRGHKVPIISLMHMGL